MRLFFLPGGRGGWRPALVLTAAIFCVAFFMPAAALGDAPSPVVQVGDQPVFTIHASMGARTAGDRAAQVSDRLTQLMKDKKSDPSGIHAVDRDGATDILFGDTTLATVTEADATAEGRNRDAVAALAIVRMRTAILKVREEYSYRNLSLGAAYAVIATIVLVVLLLLLGRLFPALYARIQGLRGTRIRSVKVQEVVLLSDERIIELLTHLAGLARFLITALLLYIYIPLVFSFFPWTRSYGRVLMAYILSPIAKGWMAFVDYLPSLLVVFVIAFFAYFALRLAQFVFREIERGTITWPGFYPDWATPTRRIVELLIVAFAIVVAFPYLPGSSSPAFKGVSLFLGVLFSLGSSSAVSNVVAGVLLTYTRAFNIGDRVEISNTTGDVVDKGLLATQVRTIKNVLVTIPNSLVLSGQVVNYSQSSTEKPLILHTTVTIGYDSPWRKIHSLLIAAAVKTEGILAAPAPFVLQTSLDDFYVSYQINAYTAQPSRQAPIFSALCANIQDQFNEAGMEIMSPHYGALRDGNTIAIPSSYRPEGYETGGILVERRG